MSSPAGVCKRCPAIAAVGIVAVLALAACSSTTPSTTSASDSASSQASTDSASAFTLADRVAVRGERVQVPDTWKLYTIDGGGSGSGNVWINPLDRHQWIEVTDGVEAGAWCGLDGVDGSIDPKQMLPAGATINRLSQSLFEFEYLGRDYASFESGGIEPIAPATVKGIWMGSPTCLSYEQLSYALPGVNQDVIDGIVHDFERQNSLE
ncbi:MAG: hypothetical protein Q7L55_05510 [Actinomycetota bacterium]|nr:hypothetical protein [Actinomycetota bacterium]